MRWQLAIAAALTALVVAASGATAAISTPTHRDPRPGAVAGQVWYMSDQHGRGVVKVFNKAHRLIAYRDVRPNRNHFRFVLKPGHYVVTLGPAKTWDLCRTRANVRVRADKTTYVNLGAACGGY